MRCLPPEIVTPPSGMPVQVSEAKAHLRVDHAEDDPLITGAIAAATGHLDGYAGVLGRALITQTWREYAACWPSSRRIALTLAPVASITSVTVRDADGVVTTLMQGTDYRLIGKGDSPEIRIMANVPLPTPDGDPDAIAITYVAGYGAPDAVPAPLRNAILEMVGDLYRFTETAGVGALKQVPTSTTVENLISPFKRNLIA